MSSANRANKGRMEAKATDDNSDKESAPFVFSCLRKLKAECPSHGPLDVVPREPMTGCMSPSFSAGKTQPANHSAVGSSILERIFLLPPRNLFHFFHFILSVLQWQSPGASEKKRGYIPDKWIVPKDSLHFWGFHLLHAPLHPPPQC